MMERCYEVTLDFYVEKSYSNLFFYQHDKGNRIIVRFTEHGEPVSLSDKSAVVKLNDTYRLETNIVDDMLDISLDGGAVAQLGKNQLIVALYNQENVLTVQKVFYTIKDGIGKREDIPDIPAEDSVFDTVLNGLTAANTEINLLKAEKADKATTYTKSETYNKTEIDTKIYNSGSGSGGTGGSNVNGNAVGIGAKAGSGFSGGNNAKAVDSEDNGIDAIQLGTGTNSTPGTLKVYDFQLLDSEGKIPKMRLPTSDLISGVYTNGDYSNIVTAAQHELFGRFDNIIYFSFDRFHPGLTERFHAVCINAAKWVVEGNFVTQTLYTYDGIYKRTLTDLDLGNWDIAGCPFELYNPLSTIQHFNFSVTIPASSWGVKLTRSELIGLDPHSYKVVTSVKQSTDASGNYIPLTVSVNQDSSCISNNVYVGRAAGQSISNAVNATVYVELIQ